ncbi:MAG: helicase, partial [Aquificota bacterium]
RKKYEEGKLKEGFMKVLVGLNVDKGVYGIYEGAKEGDKDTEVKKEFLNSIEKAFTSEELDKKEVYEQVEFFIRLLKEGKLVLRKTIEPNHAKLYIFKMDEDRKSLIPGLFITGSSNFTRAGLSLQREFNVEIKDYGLEQAEEYFDEHWERAVELSPEDIVKTFEKHTFFRKVLPFEAYVHLLKTYLDLHEGQYPVDELKGLMERKGYKPYDYQLSAVSQAVANCLAHGGSIIADVVGLGKTVIACLTAKALRKRGIVICPPHLVGDETKSSGWKRYLEDFELFGWEVFSVGKLEDALKFVREHPDVEVVIVDEAHRFRNEKTQSYTYLREICRGKTVLLLSATPFNNKPSDIFALLKLFTIPKKSTIVYDQDLESRFEAYEVEFNKLAYIKKNYKSHNEKRKKRALKYYNEIFSENKKTLSEKDIEKVLQEAKSLAKEIRAVLEPVVIRRNRLDLKYFKDSENIEFSKVDDPQEVFFELTEEQSRFYDEVIKAFYSLEEGGRFKGAIYLPEFYEKGIPINQEINEEEESPSSQEEQFLRLLQKNLYDLMRRHIVKRFESSFGAFYETLKNFKETYENVYKFIEKTGKFIYNRQEIERLLEKFEDNPDELKQALEEYAKDLEQEGKNRRYDKVYEIESFKKKKEFLEDIKSDIRLFEEFIRKVEELRLLEKDPKAQKLIEKVKGFLEEGRKVVIFSEYADTVEYLRGILEKAFPNQVLTAYGNLSKEKVEKIYKNFDAQYKEQEDEYQILLTTDKLSEGINLNRAGVVINYDIPWNPVRVIQRLGRINRIGKKVYEELYILNFFPTEKGADHVKSRDIAQAKMFMIHNVLGEDAKIFSPDEEPQPSELYKRLTSLQDEEEESFYTKVRKEFERIKREHPDVLKNIENMPRRLKVAKEGEEDELIVFIVRGRDLFVGYHNYKDKAPQVKTFEEVFEKIKAEPSSKALNLSENFWKSYERILEKDFERRRKNSRALNSNLERAYRVLNSLQIQDKEIQKFVQDLMRDIRYYHTLSDDIISQIAELEGKSVEKVVEGLENIRKLLGEDFLDRILAKQGKEEEDVIIAIENSALGDAHG